MSRIRFPGLDAHADTIAVSVAEPDGEVRKVVARLGPVNQLKACYDAGPTGCVLYWQLTSLGPEAVKKSWAQKYMAWIKEQVHFDQPALEATLLDYAHEMDHMAERIQRREKSIDIAIEKAPPEMRAVISPGRRSGACIIATASWLHAGRIRTRLSKPLLSLSVWTT